MNDQPVPLASRPQGYADWLAKLKNRIHSAQQRATRRSTANWCCSIGRSGVTS